MFKLIEKFSEYDLAIDLGSSFVKILAFGKGVLFFEPTAIARQKKKNGQIVAIGKKAKEIIGKEPQKIKVIEPVSHGVITDFDAALSLTKRLFSLVAQTPGKWLKIFGPRVIASVSCQATEVERRAVKAVMVKSGARAVFLVEKPMASAVGLELPIESSGGNLLIDIGGGTTEMAVICLNGIVMHRFLPTGGKQMDDSIISFLRLKYGILIGRLTAERIKNSLGTVSSKAAPFRSQLVVRGRNLGTGLPKSVRVSKGEIMEALLPLAQKIVQTLKELLEETPAELIDDILKRGIVLTGGMVQMPGWENLITEETKMPAWVAEKSQESVVRGCGQLLRNKNLLDRVKLVAGLQ